MIKIIEEGINLDNYSDYDSLAKEFSDKAYDNYKRFKDRGIVKYMFDAIVQKYGNDVSIDEINKFFEQDYDYLSNNIYYPVPDYVASDNDVSIDDMVNTIYDEDEDEEYLQDVANDEAFDRAMSYYNQGESISDAVYQACVDVDNGHEDALPEDDPMYWISPDESVVYQMVQDRIKEMEK